MLTLLAIAALLQPAVDMAPQGPSAPPAIQVSLNNDGNFNPGGLVQVHVTAAEDGYLAVFRVDGDGHVRVLFPLDPDADAFVRGGKEYELRGRGDRGTFLADDRPGTGMVYAAISHGPYQFRQYAANGHWDYDALRLPDSSRDAENDMTEIVAAMTDRSRFDYDAVGYRVEDLGTVTAAGVGNGYYPGFYDPYYNPRWRCLGCGWYGGATDINLGLGFGYSPFADPYLYSPWAYGYSPYGYYGGYIPGYYPIYVTPRPSRSRPRPVAPPTTVAPSSRAPGTGYGTRARPRPADMEFPGRDGRDVRGGNNGGTTVYRPSRPTFRQPSSTAEAAPPPSAQGARPRPERRPESRPVYREPPRVERTAPPPPAARSAPASRPVPAPSNHGGGGRNH